MYSYRRVIFLIISACLILLLTLSACTSEQGYALTVTATEGGTIVNEYTDISASYKEGAQIKVSATKSTGYVFDQWLSSNGGIFDNDHSLTTTFTMPKATTTITAQFKPAPTTKQRYYLRITASVGGAIPAGLEEKINGYYNAGEEISLLARSMPNYLFSRWVFDGGSVDNSCGSTAIFTMPDSDVTITAEFKAKDTVSADS